MAVARAATLEVNDATYVAWNAHDAEAVAAVFAEDAVLREAGRDGEIRGRAAIRDRALTLLRGFSDFRLERLALVVDGDGLVVEDVHFTHMAGLLAQLGLA
jgi:uncharacterized protein (TIGR02246 family)